VLLVLGFGVIMMIYSMVYYSMGPRRYSPLDSPEIRDRSKKRSKR
jgi:hypothetical protein